MNTSLTIQCHQDNTIIRTQSDYNELTNAIKQIAGYYFEVLILPTKVVIRHIGKRTFATNSKTDIAWIVNKCRYMIDNNI